MSDHPNAELLKKGYAAFAAADLDTLRELFAEDAVWYFRGKNPYAGEFTGRDAILGHFTDLFTATDGTIKVGLLTAFADDKFGVAIEHMTAERNGKTRDRHDVTVYSIKNGKVAAAWAYPEEPYELDEFLS
jgi:ketosteroid isomerase-like protein